MSYTYGYSALSGLNPLKMIVGVAYKCNDIQILGMSGTSELICLYFKQDIYFFNI